MSDLRKPRKGERRQADVADLLDSLTRARVRGVGGDVSTNHYLAVANQLISLFHQMGKGLALCLHDVGKAIKSLEIQCVSGSQCHYNSLGLILQFEKSNNLAGKRGKVMSGTQALVKLHHTENFILQFLRHLKMALEINRPFSFNDRVNVYQNTLGKYQSRFAQAGARVILTRTACRQEMVKRITKYSSGLDNPEDLLGKILEAAEPLYEDTDRLLKMYSCDVSQLQVCQDPEL